MEDLNKMGDDFEKVIDKDGCSTVRVHVDNTVQQGPQTLREKLDVLIHSKKVMVGIVVLVILDCLMVLTELLFDLEIVELGEEHKFVPKIFHYASLCILSIFLLEIGIRFYVLRLSYFKHKMEVLDAIVVIVSFILDIVFRDNEDAATGVGLLVILRLWRITRIVNSIVLSVQKQADKKVEKEKHQREACEQELAQLQEYCTAKEAELEVLQDLLRKNNIEFSVSSISRPACNSDIDIVAEVNQVIELNEASVA